MIDNDVGYILELHSLCIRDDNSLFMWDCVNEFFVFIVLIVIFPYFRVFLNLTLTFLTWQSSS